MNHLVSCAPELGSLPACFVFHYRAIRRLFLEILGDTSSLLSNFFHQPSCIHSHNGLLFLQFLPCITYYNFSECSSSHKLSVGFTFKCLTSSIRLHLLEDKDMLGRIIKNYRGPLLWNLSGHVGTWQSRQARTAFVYSSSIPLPQERETIAFLKCFKGICGFLASGEPKTYHQKPLDSLGMCRHLLVSESLLYSVFKKRILGFLHDQKRAVLSPRDWCWKVGEYSELGQGAKNWVEVKVSQRPSEKD